MNIVEFVRPHMREMPPYQPILPYEVLSKQLGIPPDKIIKLDANENPYGPLQDVRVALTELAHINIYPDPGSQYLREALSAFLGVPMENLLIGAGADELIDLIMRLVLEPGDVLLNCPPTFGMYSFDGNLHAATVIDVPRREDFSLNVDAIRMAAVQHQPKLLFLTSPNNPDGSLISHETISRLLELPLLIVLDEAYIEFAPPNSSMAKEVLSSKNLIVLRTFSKWAGLAGLRVGYGIFPSAVMPYLWKIKQPYTVSVAADWAARVSLENVEKLAFQGAQIVAERERLYELLNAIPYLDIYPSDANFILCRVRGRDAEQLKKYLEKDGILVRYFRKPGLENCIRISVGRPEDSNRLYSVLEALI